MAGPASTGPHRPTSEESRETCLILRAANEGGGSKERPAALDFLPPATDGESDESPPLDAFAAALTWRALRRVGLQSGRR